MLNRSKRQKRSKPEYQVQNRDSASVAPSASNGESANTVAPLFDDDDGSRLQFRARLLQHGLKALDDMASACVVQPEQNHTDHVASRRRDDFAEVEIERQDDPMFDEPLLEDVAVGEAVQPFVPQMDRVVTR
jgi:hypothetical protein